METEILQQLLCTRNFIIEFKNKHICIQLTDSVKNKEYFQSFRNAIYWLAEQDIEDRPDSKFAKWWNEQNKEEKENV